MMEDLSNKSKKRNVNYIIICNGWEKKIISIQVAIPYAGTTHKVPSN